MSNFLTSLFDQFPTFMAGLIGGAISLKWRKSKLTIGGAIFRVLTGAISASYFTPLFTFYLTLSSQQEHGVSFFIGLISMEIIGAIIEFGSTIKIRFNLPWLKNRKEDDTNKENL